MPGRWDSERIAAYEAPRAAEAGRPVRQVALKYRSPTPTVVVDIPVNMPVPDLITYLGRRFVRRSDDLYTEAVVWPIIAGLDAHT